MSKQKEVVGLQLLLYTVYTQTEFKHILNNVLVLKKTGVPKTAIRFSKNETISMEFDFKERNKK